MAYINPYANAFHVSVSGSAIAPFCEHIGFSVTSKQARLDEIAAKSTARRKTNWDIIPDSRAILDDVKRAINAHFGKSQGIAGRGLYANRSYRVGTIIRNALNKQQRLSHAHLEQIACYLDSFGIEAPDSMKRLRETNYFYDRIESVTPTGEEAQMYDIEVEGVHSFVSNGFVCHNSQGSEYKAVVMVLHSSQWMMLQRNLFYTGLTRARNLCLLVGDKRAIGRAVKNDKTTKRYTRLAERLRAVEANSDALPTCTPNDFRKMS